MQRTLSLAARAQTLQRAPVAAIVVAVQAVVFFPLMFMRFVDGDEGSYALAAKLVARGEQPYGDFAHYQTPLLPYVYGAWNFVAGENWYALRALSVLFAIALGTALYVFVADRLGRVPAAAALVVYAGSALTGAWLPVVKTYALGMLLLFGAYVTVERASRLRSWLLGGVLLGLAVDTRLLFAVAALPLAWRAWRASRAAVAVFAAGIVAGVVPTLAFLAVYRGTFVYDVIGAQGDRSSGGFFGDLGQKLHVAENLLGYGTPEGGLPQFLVLAAVAVIAVAWLWTLERRVSTAALVALALGVASFLPTPSYTQYFVTTIPFLAVVVAELVAAAPRVALLRISVLVAAAAYVVLGALELHRYARAQREDSIPSIEAVSRFVDAHTRPDEEVLASWPGYLYATHALPVSGLESDFSALHAASLTPAEAERYKLASAARIEQLIREHRTQIVVARMWHRLGPIPRWDETARAGGYRLLADFDGVHVYGLHNP